MNSTYETPGSYGTSVACLRIGSTNLFSVSSLFWLHYHYQNHHLSFHCCSLGNALVMIAVKTKSRLRTTKSNTDLTDIVQGGKGVGGYLSLFTPTFFQAITHHGKIKYQLHKEVSYYHLI